MAIPIMLGILIDINLFKMKEIEELKTIKVSNFRGYISQLETVKTKTEICNVALIEFSEDYHSDINSQQKWLLKYLELGLLFEEIFWLSDYFKDEKAIQNGDLILLDESVYGFKITVERSYFEDIIKFKLLFQNLFFEKKILIEELNEYKSCFNSNKNDIPF